MRIASDTDSPDFGDPGDRDGRRGSRRLTALEGEHTISRPLTDAGNAERFVDRHGHEVKHVRGWGWLVWGGKRWARDARRRVVPLAIETVRSIYTEAGTETSESDRKRLGAWGLKSEGVSRINAMLALAEADERVALGADEFDQDPHLLNCANGVVDLRTGERQDHSPQQMNTKVTQVEYDPEAKAPAWEAFLAKVLPDAEVRAYVRRMVGYMVTGLVREQKLFFLYGTGANGKSVFLNTIHSILGEYGRVAAESLLLAKKFDSHPTEMMDLCGRRFVSTSETGRGRSWDDARVKRLTGGDRINARSIAKDPVEFAPTFKLIVCANEKPRADAADAALWRRMQVIEFGVRIQKAEQDSRLEEKLRAESSGILAWAVRGAVEYCANGLGEPQQIAAATEEYRAEQDVIVRWVDDRCVRDPTAVAPFAKLYEDFMQWAEAARERLMGKVEFGNALSTAGFSNKKEDGSPCTDGHHGAAKARRGLSLR